MTIAYFLISFGSELIEEVNFIYTSSIYCIMTWLKKDNEGYSLGKVVNEDLDVYIFA